MTMAAQYMVRNIAAPLGVLTISIFGAFLVYKGFYGDAYYRSLKKLAAMEPAAGLEVVYSDDMSYVVVDQNGAPLTAYRQ